MRVGLVCIGTHYQSASFISLFLAGFPRSRGRLATQTDCKPLHCVSFIASAYPTLAQGCFTYLNLVSLHLCKMQPIAGIKSLLNFNFNDVSNLKRDLPLFNQVGLIDIKQSIDQIRVKHNHPCETRFVAEELSGLIDQNLVFDVEQKGGYPIHKNFTSPEEIRKVKCLESWINGNILTHTCHCSSIFPWQHGDPCRF